MRDIKFRAWNYKSFEMLYFDNNDMWDTNWLNMPECMQYTGLKDKKGQEVYEGDIIEGWPIIGNDPIKAKVIFHEKKGMWLAEEIHHEYSETEYLFEILKDDRHQAKVIGNIHENPELL